MHRKVRTAVRLAVIALAIATMSSCSLVAEKKSILVKTVSGNLAFGAPVADAQVETLPGPNGSFRVILPPAPTDTSSPGAGLSNGGPTPFGTGSSGVAQSSSSSSSAAAKVNPCPVPGNDVFPQDPATPDIEHQPKPGVYQFRSAGQVNSAGKVSKLDPLAFLNRTVHALTTAADASNSGAFKYAYDGGFGYQALDGKLAAGFTARPNSTDASNGVQPPPPPGGPAPVPQDGVFLSSLSFTPPGGSTFNFTAPLGVQVLQAPAVNQAQWQSSANDSGGHGTSISFKGGINTAGDPKQNGRERVAGCGEVFDAWRVDGTLALTGPGYVITDTVTFDFATQYGGLLIAEHDVLSSSGTVNLSGSDFGTSLNHLNPGPLPAGVN